MITVTETTFKEPQYNHKYILSDDKMRCYGYIKHGQKEPEMFEVPLKFNPKGRTFK